MLEISLNKIPICSERDDVLLGEIRINDFSEFFHASLSYWSREDYISQWKRALKMIQDGKSESALITNMYNPKYANFIIWWVLYRDKKKVAIQNYMLFMDNLEEPFRADRFEQYIPERKLFTEEGEPISEWEIDISDIQVMISSL